MPRDRLHTCLCAGERPTRISRAEDAARILCPCTVVSAQHPDEARPLFPHPLSSSLPCPRSLFHTLAQHHLAPQDRVSRAERLRAEELSAGGGGGVGGVLNTQT